MSCTRYREVDLPAFVVDPRAQEWADFRDHHPGCPDCTREVARFADLVTALRNSSGAGGAHLSAEQVVAFGSESNRLPPGERERFALHLAGCAPCRTELAALERFDVAALASRPQRSLTALRRYFPPVPMPALAAALLVLLALPALYWWQTTSDEVVHRPEPRLAQVEREVESPTAPAPAEPPSPARPREVAKPITAKVERPEQIAEPIEAPGPPQREPEHGVPNREPREPERPLAIAALLPSEAPRYVPGPLAGGEDRRIGSVSRGRAGSTIAPQVLAPAHVGRTSRASPTLYWFLPDSTTSPVELTVVDPEGVEPLLEETFPPPVAAGVHALSLAKPGVQLTPGVEYQWFVTIVVDPARRSNDVVSGASVRRGAAPGSLATVPPERLAHALAEAGLWYDAFDQLSAWLAAEPHSPLLRKHRAALLEQVGLDAVARFERERGGS